MCKATPDTKQAEMGKVEGFALFAIGGKVCFLVVTEIDFPPSLAFSFLNTCLRTVYFSILFLFISMI